MSDVGAGSLNDSIRRFADQGVLILEARPSMLRLWSAHVTPGESP